MPSHSQEVIPLRHPDMNPEAFRWLLHANLATRATRIIRHNISAKYHYGAAQSDRVRMRGK